MWLSPFPEVQERECKMAVKKQQFKLGGTKPSGVSAYDNIWGILADAPEEPRWKECDSEIVLDAIDRVTLKGDAILFYRGRNRDYLGFQILADEGKVRKTSGHPEEIDELLSKLSTALRKAAQEDLDEAGEPG
jgi:hypothetical protein